MLLGLVFNKQIKADKNVILLFYSLASLFNKRRLFNFKDNHNRLCFFLELLLIQYLLETKGQLFKTLYQKTFLTNYSMQSQASRCPI